MRKNRKPAKSLFIEGVIFPIGDLFFCTEVTRQLKTQRSYTNYSEAQLEKLQTKKLKKILQHSTQSCQAYRNQKNTEENPKNWLKKFPIISKTDIITNTARYISDKFKKEDLIKYETSGSSGVRSVVYVDKKEQSTFRAILINWWEWNGYYLGKPMMQTGITPNRGFIKSIKDKLLSTIYVDAFGLTEEGILQKLRKVEGKKGMHLFGFASSLYELAKVAKKYELNVQFKRVMSQGDKLFPHYQKLLEEVFKAPVVEDYGLNEGIMIGQKKDLPYFYIYTPSVYLEILDDKGSPVPDGEMGRAVVTKLDGFAMPLIRYDTGDLAVKLPRDRYPESRDLAFPLLERVIGRNTDIIETPDGKKLIVHTFTGIFEFFPEITQFQVVQNEVESINIRYIPSENFTQNVLLRIEAQFRKKTKSNIAITWERVAEIMPSKSGKPQLVINNLLKRSLADTND